MDTTNLFQYAWYYGKINRQEAEENLMDRGENEGCFLVRESKSRQGNWTLSVLDWVDGGCSVGHYLIYKNPKGGYYFDEDTEFDSIPKLIDYYKAHPKTVTFTIKEPCPREVLLPDKDEDEYDLYEIATELPLHQTFHKESLISSSSVCAVWKGHLGLHDTVKIVAKIAVGDSQESKHILMHEANMLKCLCHENIVKMRGVISKTTPFHLLQDYAGDTNLIGLLLKNGRSEFTLMDQLNVSIQIASALSFCEKMKCVHRNVKAKSVIVNTTDLKCRLGSFKHARTIDTHGFFHDFNTDHSYSIVHTSRLRWMSLEAAKQGRYSHASDAWSFGIFLIELFTGGALPYAGYLTSRILSEVEEGFRCSKPTSCPMEIYELMHQCWMFSETTRPDFSTIKNKLVKYRDDNYEALVKLIPTKSRDKDRYAPCKQLSVKQQRTARSRPAPPNLPPVSQYGYDN
ncbi:tyrosine-protein kinase yes-like [Styela clava]